MSACPFKVGEVVCGWTPDTHSVFGRILEICFWYGDEDCVSHMVVEDFPSMGREIIFVWPADFSGLKVINGTGLGTPKWTKETGKWERIGKDEQC